MAGYNAGSVTAQIKLDTEQFEEALLKLRDSVASFKSTVKKSNSDVADSVKQLEKDYNTLQSRNKDLGKSINRLKKENESLKASLYGTSDAVNSGLNYMKNLSPEISKAVKNITKLDKANQKLNNTLKKTNKQAQFGMTNLEKSFTKRYYELVNDAPQYQGNPNRKILKPVFDALEKEYKQYVRDMKGFQRLMIKAVSTTGTSLVPANSRVTGLTPIYLGGKENKPSSAGSRAFDRINVEALKTKEEVKKAMQGIEDSVDKVTESTKKATEATEELQSSQSKLLAKSKVTLKELVKDYENLPIAVQTAVDGIRRSISKMEFGAYPLHGGYFSGNGGDLAEKLFMEEIKAWAKFIPNFDIDEILKKVFPIKKMSNRLSVFDEMHGWDKWYGGTGEGHFPKNMKPVYTPPYQVDEITGLKTTLKYLEQAEIVSRKTGESVKETSENIKQLGASEEQTLPTTKKLTDETKKLGEATEYTATQIKILKDIYSQAQKTPFKSQRTYLNLENKYDKDLTGMSMGAVISPEKLRERIKRELQPLFSALGIGFEGKGRGEVPLLDASNLINETEFKTLIGEIDEVSESAEVATNNVQKLGLATDEFGFVYLGELIAQFEKLPSELQKVVKNISRVVQKASKELYPRKGMKEYQNDLLYSSFPLSKYGIPFNTGDLRYFGALDFINDIPITAEQVQDSKELIDQILQFFGNFYPEAYKKINDITYKNSRFVREDLQYTLDTLKELEIHTKETAKAMNILRANRYGFLKGEDKYNKQYLRNTLNNGFDTYSRIMPKDVESRAFTPSDKEFLERVFSQMLSYYFTEGTSHIDARHLFKYPSWKQLGIHEKMNMPFSTEYMYNFEDTKEGYEEFIKWAHTRMIRDLKLMNIDLSKELSRSQQGVRVWFENLKKWQNMYSLDITKALQFEDMRAFTAYIDRVTESMAYLGIGIDKTALKTTKLRYALEEAVNWEKNLLKEQEKARIKAEQLANGTRIGVELWGTPEEFRNAMLGFRNLMNGVMELGTVEETTSKSTDKLTKSTYSLGSSISGMYRAIVESPRNMEATIAFAKEYIDVIKQLGETTAKIKEKDIRSKLSQMHPNGSLDDHQWWSLLEHGRRTDVWKNFARDNVKSYYYTAGKGYVELIASIQETDKEVKQVTEDINKLSESLNIVNRVKIGDSWTVTLKSTNMALRETVTCLDSFVGEIPKAIEETERLSGAEDKLTVSSKKTSNALQNIIKSVKPVGNLTLFDGGSFFAPVSVNNATTQVELLGVLLKKADAQAEGLADAIRKVSKSANDATINVRELVSAVEHTGRKHSFGDLIAPPISQINQYISVIKKYSSSLAQLFNPTKLLENKSNIKINPIIDEYIKPTEKAINKVKKLLNELDKDIGQINPNGIKDYATQMERLGKVEEKVSTNSKRLKENLNIPPKYVKNIENIFQKLNRLDKESSVLFDVDSRNLRPWGLNGKGEIIGGDVVANTTKALKTLDATVLDTAKDIETKLINAIRALMEANKDNEDFVPPVEQWKQALAEIESFARRYEVLQQRMYELSRKNYFSKTESRVNTGYGKVLQDLEIAKQTGASVVGDYSLLDPTMGSKGRINVEGYSDYVARLSEIVTKLKEASTGSNEFREQLTQLATAIKENNNSLTGFVGKAESVVMSLTQMAEANERFVVENTKVEQQINRLKTQINSLSGTNKKNTMELAVEGRQITILANKFANLTNKLRQEKISVEEYDVEIKKLVGDLSRLYTEVQLTSKSISQTGKATEETSKKTKGAGNSLREFGKSMSDSEKYANNLYRGLQKVRSIIISLKTIGRMMGGMAVWNFAFELLESAKETYVAKNEMESLLNKNSKVNASGVDTFNRALDETVDRFQKINKYSLGETASSIGLEFNLSAQQMSKSLPIIAMVQNEYVRAGRTVEEASLAVKDILQGEFMRLSRETGVGKDDLMEKYGWNGDNTDVISLMKALEKAGKERHWDLFAEKATSLNDVLTITKSRFSELGAEIGTTAEPLIVGAFNAILDVVDSLKKGFEGLGSFGKNMVTGLGLPVLLKTLGTAYLMLAKDMGIADVANVGFTKSLLSSALQLNKTDVALHGFWKTLLANISGTKASTVANIGFTKSLAGRIMGLNQEIIAERGLGTAMVQNISKYKEEVPVIEIGNKIKGEKLNLEKASILNLDKTKSITSRLVQTELTRSQRLAYMTTNLKYAEVAELSRGKALLKTITSWKVLGTVLKGITAIGIASWFAQIASWADQVKTRVAGFNDLVDNGKSLVKEAKEQWVSSSKAVDDINAKIEKYNSENKDTTQLLRERNALIKDSTTAYKNLYLVQKASSFAQKASAKLEQKQTKINTHLQTLKAKALMEVGNTSEEAQLLSSDAWINATSGAYYRNKALNEYKREYEGLIEDSKQHGKYLKENGVEQEKINRFMADYDIKAQQASEHLKQFNEGDLWAGAYYWLDKLTLEWIKFTNSPTGDQLFNSLGRFVEWITPHVETLLGYLKEMGKVAIDAFSWLTSTDLGNIVVSISGLALGVGVLALKFKGVRSALVKVGKVIWNRIKDWKDLGDKAEEAGKKIEEANDKMGGDKSTGGINGEVEKGETPKLGDELKEIGKTRLKSWANNALLIAEGMALVTEAILLLKAPMGALSEVGKDFKNMEPDIREGIEGLKLITPVVLTILAPIIALQQILSKYGGFMSSWGDLRSNLKAFATMAIGIAEGMLLVAEAIVMIIPSIWALGMLGDQYQGVEEQAKKGVEAMKLVSSSLGLLLPFVPALIGGLLLGIAVFESGVIGGALTLAVVAGIALGIGLVAEAILCLEMPLWSLGKVGEDFHDLSNVQKGAEAVKLVAEAMTYVTTAIGAMVLVKWELLAGYLADLVGKVIGTDITSNLNKLTEEGGYFDQLNQFIKSFNTFTFEPVNVENVEALKSIGTGMNAISDAMKAVTSALDNLPEEFKNGGQGNGRKPLLTYNMENDTTSINAQDQSGENGLTGYFDQLKKPLSELKTFIDDFNKGEEFNIQPPDQSRIDAINQSANMVTAINTAVENLKNAMSNIALGNIGTGLAQFTSGFLNPVGWFTGTATSGYTSSIGTQLSELEKVIKDLNTFNSHIANMGSTGEEGGEGGGSTGNVEALTGMVTAVADAVQKLQDTLSQAVPNISQSAKDIGTGIKSGITDGMGDLTSLIIPRFVEAMNSLKAHAFTYGKGAGWKLSHGFEEELKFKEAMEAEKGYLFEYIDQIKPEFYSKGAELGKELSEGYKSEGLKQESPGLMARTTLQEMFYIQDSLEQGMSMLPSTATELGSTISSNFNPDLDIGGISVDELSQFQYGLNSVTAMANDTNLQTSTAFTNMNTSVTTSMQGMNTTVSGNFNNIATNATASYNRIVNTTRVSLANMQSQTTKNINAIKLSWRNMQTALIQSAENIRSETSAKISSLQANMASFWQKVQNPALLLGAGGHVSRSAPRYTPVRSGTTTRARLPMAGSGTTSMGIKKRSVHSNAKMPNKMIAEYLQCLLNGGVCASGGWDFNWSPDIKRALLQWHTHFGEIYDDVLTVGKFENDDFPVRGNRTIALRYIEDAIKQTSYEGYFDSKYGSPLEAWNAGHFNCVDGALVAIALANAFGFGGGTVQYGTWDGIGHGFAVIPGLGVIDATAIQNGYGLTAPGKVTGYPSAGSISRTSSKNRPRMGDTHNYNGDVIINIHTDGHDVEVDDKKIDDETGKKIIDLLGINPHTGL